VGYKTPNTLDQLREIAATFDCELYVGAPDLLLLDLDNGDAEKQFLRTLPVVAEKFGPLDTVDGWKSRGAGRHLVLRLPQAMTVVERLLLQDVLGSDPVRTALALHEFRTLDSDTIFLFKPKQEPKV
jgi:hypothetical protein